VAKFVNVKRVSLLSKASLDKISSLNLSSRELTGTFLIFEDDIPYEGLEKDFLKAFDGFTILSNDTISKSQVVSWIEARFKALKLDFPKNISRTITDIAGNDIDYSMQIVERLYLLSPKDAAEWEKALENFPKDYNAVIFDLSDALLGSKKEESLRILSHLLEEGLSFENILYYLINHYSFLCEVKLFSLKYNTKKEILKAMSDKSAYRVEKAYSQIRRISFKSLNKALSSLIKIEKDFKSGQLTDISNALPLFVGGSK